MQLVVENIAKSFGIHEIFKNVSFMMEKGRHFGLVGANGSGKSTLLKGLLEPAWLDAGSVKFEQGTRVGYVEQGFSDIAGTVFQFMLKSSPEVLELRKKLQNLETLSAELSDEAMEACLAEYASVTRRYEFIDGYNYEIRIRRVLTGLGFKKEVWDQDAKSLSGGQKTRLMLAAALVSAPDFMILDEPTNHLDIVMTEWLEQYLKEFKGGLIVVSHDRAFLDNVTDGILEMEGGRLKAYKGNYSRYFEQKLLETATLQAAYSAQQDYIARTEAYIRRFKAGIKSKMARGRKSQLERLKRIEAPIRTEEFSLSLPPAAECAQRVLVMEDLAIGYKGVTLVSGINLVLQRGEKAALLGANGTGKTTLLKTLLGDIEPLHGKAFIGNRVHIGYFSQSYERLKMSDTLLENFVIEYGLAEDRARALLGGMLFHGDDVFKQIGDLSGGQKARLVLLKLVLDGANCLVLDEPTNHLDIAGREAVEAALAAFDGTVLVVSHDRYFVGEIATRIWEIDGGRLCDYKGNYAFYLEEKSRLAQLEAERSKERPVPAAKEQPAKEARTVKAVANSGQTAADGKKDKRRLSSEEARRQLAKIELRIREEEAMLKVLEKKLSDPANHKDAASSAALAAEYASYERTVEKLMEEWEFLMEACEATC